MATVPLQLMFVSDVACNMATVRMWPMSACGYSISVMLSLNDCWQSNMKFAKKFLIPNSSLWNFSYHFTPSLFTCLICAFPVPFQNNNFGQTPIHLILTSFFISKIWSEHLLCTDPRHPCSHWSHFKILNFVNNIICNTFFTQPQVKFLCNNHLFQPPIHGKEPTSTHFTLRNH